MSAFFIFLALSVGLTLISVIFSAGRSARVLAERSRPWRDPAVMQVVGRIGAALDLPAIRVNVFDEPTINGLAAADGQIYLTRGFVDAYQAGRVSADELGAVVAHELGHVALGHLRRRMIDFTGQNAVFLLVAALLNRVLPLVGLWIANLLMTALMARLSRRDEFEADAWAAAVLVRAGLGTGPEKRLLAKLDRLTGAGSGLAAQVPAWARSHPASQDRIRAIEALEDRWGL